MQHDCGSPGRQERPSAVRAVLAEPPVYSSGALAFLADQLIAGAASATDRILGGALSALGADIARAECFALSDDIRSSCAEHCEVQGRMITS